jgi:hypothetical protein
MPRVSLSQIPPFCPWPPGTKYVQYIEYHSVCPLVGTGTLPPPLSLASECAPPPEPKGWGTLACGLGVGGVPIPTTGEKLSTLPTLCAPGLGALLFVSIYVADNWCIWYLVRVLVPKERPLCRQNTQCDTNHLQILALWFSPCTLVYKQKAIHHTWPNVKLGGFIL